MQRLGFPKSVSRPPGLPAPSEMSEPHDSTKSADGFELELWLVIWTLLPENFLWKCGDMKRHYYADRDRRRLCDAASSEWTAWRFAIDSSFDQFELCSANG